MNSFVFPSGTELQQILNLQVQAQLDDFLSQSLTAPLQDLFSRPKKDIRGELVRLGFHIACQKMNVDRDETLTQVLPQACEILEILHAGSLIIDDIEDQTAIRRGQKALHVEYGLPVALNAGNWLYFLPFQKIEQMKVPLSTQALLARECQRTLLRAHYGQALDVGIQIDSVPQARVPEISLATMELKSGVLTSFALQLGALVTGCQESWLIHLEVWGRKLGVSLQMFDDIGNLSSKQNPEKRGEDLKHKRPSFLFAVASEVLCESDYKKLMALVKQPQSLEETIKFIQQHEIDLHAKNKAFESLQSANHFFENELNLDLKAHEILEQITMKLVKSYG